MRLLFFAYFVIEVLAFIGVARLIGLGWAFLAVFALSVLGGVGANIALRNSLTRAAGGRNSLGRFAGDSAILAAGWILCILPGFVSSLVGLVLIFPPTRALVRRSLTAKATKAVEDFSMRVYSASPVSRQFTSYGTFRTEQPGGGDVIDADELEQWYRADSATDTGPDTGSDPHRDGGTR